MLTERIGRGETNHPKRKLALVREKPEGKSTKERGGKRKVMVGILRQEPNRQEEDGGEGKGGHRVSGRTTNVFRLAAFAKKNSLAGKVITGEKGFG